MYFQGISSSFKKNEHRRKVINKLEELKDDVDSLVTWDKIHVDECNRWVIKDKYEYDNDYLELQGLINKLLNKENKV